MSHNHALGKIYGVRSSKVEARVPSKSGCRTRYGTSYVLRLWGEESVGEFGKVLFVHKRNVVLPVLPLGYYSLLLPQNCLDAPCKELLTQKTKTASISHDNVRV